MPENEVKTQKKGCGCKNRTNLAKTEAIKAQELAEKVEARIADKIKERKLKML